MASAAAGPPLLSQDEFFRHLSLQSVHSAAAKYHYRLALKERLRATSKVNHALMKPESVSLAKRSEAAGHDDMQEEPDSEILVEGDQRALAAPSVHSEAIKKQLTAVILRHPGIRKEVVGPSGSPARNWNWTILPADDGGEVLGAVAARHGIQIRRCFSARPALKGEVGLDDGTKSRVAPTGSTAGPAGIRVHHVRIRLQPGSRRMIKLDSEERVRKLATLALFGHSLHRPNGIQPHAVAISSLARAQKPGSSSSQQRHQQQHQGSFLGTVLKRRPSKLPKVCLSGSASVLLSSTSRVERDETLPEPAHGTRDCPSCPATPAEEIKLKCPHCPRSFTTKSGLSYHVHYTHGLRNCGVCGRPYKVPTVGCPSTQSSSLTSNFPNHTTPSVGFDAFCLPCLSRFYGVGHPHQAELHQHQHPRSFSRVADDDEEQPLIFDPLLNAVPSGHGASPGPPSFDALTAHKADETRHAATMRRRLFKGRYKCDICSKSFDKRSSMIRHITNNHPVDMHKVELSKFVATPKKLQGGTAE